VVNDVTEAAPHDLRDMTARQVIEALELEYLDGEGCWIKLLWRTQHANGIYALITAEDFSAMHRLVEDEAWTFVAGSPAEMLILHPDGSHETVCLGADLGSGHVPHHRIPAHTWQGTLTTEDWTLVTCVLAPPFSRFELADGETDFSTWSDARDAIGRRMRG